MTESEAPDDQELPRTGSSHRVRVLRVGGGRGSHGPDSVVVEEPLTVRVQHRGAESVLGSTMRTPGQDLDLAVGLAVAEGVLARRHELRAVRQCRTGTHGSTNDLVLDLDDSVAFDASSLGRVSHPSSACGMCGRDEIEQLMNRCPPASSSTRVEASVLLALPHRMLDAQALFRRTGGLHAAALATADGDVLLVREDVGRHNAVDKVVGRTLLDGLHGEILVVSGRAGFEIVQKAAMAAIPVVVSVSAPTSLSVDAARSAGITLAAFVRDDRMTVYSGEHRVYGFEEDSRW